MKKYMFFVFLAATAMMIAPHIVRADEVALPCSGSDCGPVSIPGNNPPAPDPGTAPGHPIEAPDQPNRDPIAPNEPPSPSN